MWVEGQSFWYYLITYCFFELVYAMEIIPYETLAAEMSPNYQTKAKFAGARILCGQIANIAAMWLPGVIIAQLGGKESADTFLYLGVIFSVFFVFVALAVFLFTWERPRGEIVSVAPRDAGTKSSPFHVITDLFRELVGHVTHPRIPPASRHVHRRLHQPGRVERRTVVHHRVHLPRVGRHRLIDHDVDGVRAARLGRARHLAYVADSRRRLVPHRSRLLRTRHPRIRGALFRGRGRPQWFLAVAIVAGLGRGALNYIPWSVYNYMPDVDEIVTGRRREGAFAGVMTFIRKLLQSAVVFAVGPILDASGLVRNVEDPARARRGHGDRRSCSSAASDSCSSASSSACASSSTARRTPFSWMRSSASRRSAGTAPTPENRAIVEDLTGWKYEELWGKGKS